MRYWRSLIKVARFDDDTVHVRVSGMPYDETTPIPRADLPVEIDMNLAVGYVFHARVAYDDGRVAGFGSFEWDGLSAPEQARRIRSASKALLARSNSTGKW